MIRRLLCLSITTATLIFYTCLGHTSDAATSYSIDDESLGCNSAYTASHLTNFINKSASGQSAAAR